LDCCPHLHVPLAQFKNCKSLGDQCVVFEALVRHSETDVTVMRRSKRRAAIHDAATTADGDAASADVIHADAADGVSADYAADGGRQLFVSNVVRWDAADNEALRLLMAALVKMNALNGLRQLPMEPFERLSERKLIKFVKGSQSWFWSSDLRLLSSENVQWHSVLKMKQTDKIVYAVDDLGRGYDGRVWFAVALRTSTTTGVQKHMLFPLVLKFGNRGEVNVQDEYKMWLAAYPQFKAVVGCETWSGRVALRMPHFTEVPVSSKNELLPKVEETLRAFFLEKGLIHADVKWKNIGMYLDGGMTRVVAVFDLKNVKRAEDRSDQWILDAIDELRESAAVTEACSDTTAWPHTHASMPPPYPQ
jgi:hypothetical protein